MKSNSFNILRILLGVIGVGLYAVHGFLMLYTAIHLHQYLSLAKIFGCLHIAIGLTMLGIDLTTPMPLYWTAVEGIPIAVVGTVLVWLSVRADAESATHDSDG